MNDGAKTQKAQALVVLSGGQDSALCLALACREFGAERVAAITFEYGQRHLGETAFAKALAGRFGVMRHKTVELAFYSELTTNALMDSGREIAKDEGASAPNTLVEGRNAFFLLAAGVWAKELGAKIIYTGVSQADYSGYPDCREEFIRAQEKAMTLAMEWPFEIRTPFMHKTKKDEWALAAELGIFDVIANETLTCYNGIPGRGCGQCPACKLRSHALEAFLAENPGYASQVIK